MPFHLISSSRSRRDFIRQATFAGGGAWLAGHSLSADAQEAGGAATQERWAFLSDTHIDADPAFVSRQGTCVAETFQQVIAEVVAEAESLDAVIIDGDCAFNVGLPGDYETLAKLLEPLQATGLPLHMTLGNHDDRDNFSAAFAAHQPENPPLEGKHVSVVEGAQANWVMLDSLRFVNKVEGEFGEAQLAWLDQWLATHSDKPVILIGHHYPQVFRTDVIPGDQKIKISGLVDSEAFLALTERHRQVKAYVYGHSHNWKTATEASGIHHINLPPTSYVFNPERPNGWVRATVSPAGLSLELRALDRAHPEHGNTAELAWR